MYSKIVIRVGLVIDNDYEMTAMAMWWWWYMYDAALMLLLL